MVRRDTVPGPERGLFANQSDGCRRVIVIHVRSHGVRSARSEPLLHGIAVVPRGAKVEG